jgi:hypothetical protein
MAVNLSGKTFHLESLSFEPSKPSGSGGRSVGLKHDGQNFTLNTTQMISPFDLTKPDERGKYSLNLTFKADSFFNLCSQLDTKILNYVISNPKVCCDWLGCPLTKPFSKEVIESKYIPILKWSKNKATGEIQKQFQPRIKINLPQSKSNPQRFECDFFNAKEELVEVTTQNLGQLIPPQTSLIVLMSGYIWSTSSLGFGLSWTARQVMIKELKPRIKKCMIQADPKEEEEEEEDS